MNPFSRLLAVVLALLAHTPGNAQTGTAAMQQQLEHVFAPKKHNTARTTAATATRLTGTSSWSYDGTNYVFGDTSVLNYSGTRGHGPLKEAWLYDSWTHVWYSGMSWRQLQTFDVNNNVTESIEQNWDTVTHVWENSSKRDYIYDASNNPIVTLMSQWDTVTSTWDSITRRFSTYDAANNLLQELDLGWTGTAWENNQKVNYTYDVSNNRLGYISATWIMSAWYDNVRHTYTYNGGGDRDADLMETMGSGGWENGLRDSFSYLPGHMFDKMVTQNWNGTAFVNAYRWQYTWNTIDTLPEHFSTSSWNATAGVWDTIPGNYIYYFYYETYTTGTHQASENTKDINVYPVPAKNELNIHIGWQQLKAFTIVLADVAGRVYVKMNIAATKQYDDKIPVAGLPGGNYILSISDGTSISSRTVTILK